MCVCVCVLYIYIYIQDGHQKIVSIIRIEEPS